MFAHGEMGLQVNGGPIEIFLVPASDARLVSCGRVFAHGEMGLQVNGRPIEIFLVPASDARLVCTVLPV